MKVGENLPALNAAVCNNFLEDFALTTSFFKTQNDAFLNLAVTYLLNSRDNFTIRVCSCFGTFLEIVQSSQQIISSRQQLLRVTISVISYLVLQKEY